MLLADGLNRVLTCQATFPPQTPGCNIKSSDTEYRKTRGARLDGDRGRSAFLIFAVFILSASAAVQFWINVELGVLYFDIPLVSSQRPENLKFLGKNDAESDPDLLGALDDRMPTYWVHAAYRASMLCGDCISPAILDNLSKSYEISPLNWSLARWRIKFAFDHWSHLNETIRRRAVTELRASWSSTANQAKLFALTDQISDPSGAVFYRLVVSGLKSNH